MYRDTVREALENAANQLQQIGDKALHWEATFINSNSTAERWGHIKKWAWHQSEEARAALAAPSAVEELVATLGEAWEQIIWMSGSSDFGPEGIAHKGWIKSADLRKRIPEILAKYGAAP